MDLATSQQIAEWLKKRFQQPAKAAISKSAESAGQRAAKFWDYVKNVPAEVDQGVGGVLSKIEDFRQANIAKKKQTFGNEEYARREEVGLGPVLNFAGDMPGNIVRSGSRKVVALANTLKGSKSSQPTSNTGKLLMGNKNVPDIQAFNTGNQQATEPYIGKTGSKVVAPLITGAAIIGDLSVGGAGGKKITKEGTELGTKAIAKSVLQTVNKKGELSYKVILEKDLKKISELIDNARTNSGKSKAIAGMPVKGETYHLTAKTPQQMDEAGGIYKGVASADDIPSFEKVKSALDRASKFIQDKKTGKMAGSEAGKIVPQAPVVEPYKETGDLTTSILKTLEGKSTVSKQFISDSLNRPNLKQTERDILTKALQGEGDKVNVKSFADKVKDDLLPLKKTGVGGTTEYGAANPKYGNITLPPETRGNVAHYSERVYESPIPTSAGNTHWRANDTKNYFGHTRVEDLAGESKGVIPFNEETDTLMNGQTGERFAKGDTRRVIEVQSDLYQKGNLQREQASTLPESGELKFDTSQQKDRYNELEKLKQYSDPTAHYRMVREEIKQAAKDGKTKLQFPTGETAMKIEGLGGRVDNVWVPTDRVGDIDAAFGQQNQFADIALTVDELQPGREVKMVGGVGEWVITKNLGDGKFKAVPKDVVRDIDPNDAEALALASRYSETFDISGKVDTSNPIYKFYEKDLGKYLQNKHGAQMITDPQGVKWWQVDIKPEHGKLPVEAFGILGGGLGSALAIEQLRKRRDETMI